MKRVFLALLFVLPFIGCGKKDPNAPHSTAEEVIDHATGNAAVRQYLDTRETIKDIDLKNKERFSRIPNE